jgi:hypothetical protein
MNYQEQLLKEIRKQLQASTSINDAISSIYIVVMMLLTGGFP